MKKIRCAIYDRVSTEIQATSGLSLDTQKELLTEYAKSHGYEIVGYYADEGLTARKKLQNRKDFQRLLGDIQNDKIAHCISSDMYNCVPPQCYQHRDGTQLYISEDMQWANRLPLIK